MKKRIYLKKKRVVKKKKNFLLIAIIFVFIVTYITIHFVGNVLGEKLIEYAKVPIAAPSANISGNPSGIELNTIMNEFKENVDYYIDGGKSKIGLASTIVQVVDGVPYILREGSISKEQIEEVCKRYK